MRVRSSVDEGVDSTWLFLMVIGALICGALVLFFKPEYRFQEIVKSNENYYPAVPANPPVDDSNG